MKFLKITKQSINEAVGILRRGGTVVFPTETAYGLGADAMNKKAVAKIFKIKKRPRDKGLPAICYSKKQVEKFFEMPRSAWKIWQKYWPKPVSIILRRKGTFLRTQIPVRISSNKTARDLARKLGWPITATSANLSGAGAMYDAKEIAKIFSKVKHKPDLILDGGRLPQKSASTIIKIVRDKIEIIRQGEVKISSM